MIKIILELDQPDYQTLATLAEKALAEHPEAGKQLGGFSPKILMTALKHLPPKQVNQLLIQALEQQKEQAIPTLEQKLREQGADLEIIDFTLSDEDGLTFSMIANVSSWFPFIRQILPRLVPLNDLPERMGNAYQIGMTADDYADYLSTLSIYDQTVQFFSCCTAAKERTLSQTQQMLQQQSLPLRIRNMRFFVKR